MEGAAAAAATAVDEADAGADNVQEALEEDLAAAAEEVPAGVAGSKRKEKRPAEKGKRPKNKDTKKSTASKKRPKRVSAEEGPCGSMPTTEVSEGGSSDEEASAVDTASSRKQKSGAVKKGQAGGKHSAAL